MKRIISIIAATLLMTGCVTNPPNYVPTKTSLELQAIQSREFETPKRIAFASAISVFQDFGYQITSSDLDTGYIAAKSPTQHDGWYGIRTMKDTKATAFVEELRPGVTKVRLSFVNTLERSGTGVYAAKVVQDTPIEDPAVYNNAFVKIQEAIFIRSGTN
jgi:hypothetical protein